MTSSPNFMQEPPVTNCYSADSFDSDGMYEYCPSLLEAIRYLDPVSDSYSPYEGDALCGYTISSPYEKDEVYLAATSYERDRLSYNSWRNWEGEYDSSFTLSGSFDDNSFSYGDVNGQEKAECWLQSDEHGDSCHSHHDTAGNHLSFDDTAWSANEPWFGCVGEEDSYYYGGPKLTYACSYKSDELGPFESIFGYWPCLHQQHPQMYAE